MLLKRTTRYAFVLRALLVIGFWGLLLVPAAYGQGEAPKNAIQFLSSENIAVVNLNKEALLSYVKGFNTELSAALLELKGPHEIRVLQTLHKVQPVSISVHARPALAVAELQRIEQRLRAIAAPHTRFSDFSLLYLNLVNGAVAGGASFEPVLRLPGQEERARFETLSLAGQLQEIRRWAAQEAVPILVAFEAQTEARFAGVHNLGTTLEQIDLTKPQSVATLTDYNYDYWRACLEMDSGNQLIPMTKTLLLASQGELGRAGIYLQLLRPVSDPKAVPTELAEELKWRLTAFNSKLNPAIQAGIALNDQNKFDEALGAYNQILTAFPGSAWTQYEKFFTERARYMAQHKAALSDNGLWERARAAIYAADPIYASVGQLSSGKEAYQYAKRQEINKLFKDPQKTMADYTSFADTALLLDEYALAAQFYWILFAKAPGADGQPNEQFLTKFLYCLDKLGEHRIAENFKGNFAARFAAIESGLDKDMKASPIYKAFKQ